MGRRSGFTLLELTFALALATIVIVKLFLVIRETSEVQSRGSTEMAIEDQAYRLLDQIAFAVMGASRETLFPDPESPIHSDEIQYEVNLGLEDGVVIWGDPEWIGLSETETQAVWTVNRGEEDERSVVWCNFVRPFHENELENGADDNANGLADERGLSFVLDDDSVHIRLTLERIGPDGEPVRKTVHTTVTCRN